MEKRDFFETIAIINTLKNINDPELLESAIGLLSNDLETVTEYMQYIINKENYKYYAEILSLVILKSIENNLNNNNKNTFFFTKRIGNINIYK